MLRRLAIRHYALIDHIEWDVEQGWTVLTGETGSGKSILLGALGLVLGARAEGVEIGERNASWRRSFRSLRRGPRQARPLDEGATVILRRSIALGGAPGPTSMTNPSSCSS